MNVHVTLPSLIDIRQIIESLIFGAHLHSQNSFDPCSNSPETDSTVQGGKVNECCVCAPCLDIISHSHSASRAEYANHGRHFVHNWLETASAFDYTPPRQIPYGCDEMADGYLQLIEKKWGPSGQKDNFKSLR